MPSTIYGRTYARVKVTEHAPRLQEGEIFLKSRALRHAATWAELDDVSVRHFEIDSKCPTSEMASYGLLPKDMKKIDTIGYQTRGELYHNHIHETPSVDTTILEAQKNVLGHERMAQEVREREKNTETTLWKIVELFPKGLSLPIEDLRRTTGRGRNDKGGMVWGRPVGNAQENVPKNTRRIIPSSTPDTRTAPTRGVHNGWRGGRGCGRGKATVSCGGDGDWRQGAAGTPIADAQPAAQDLSNGRGAQGAVANNNADWPPLECASRHRRRSAIRSEVEAQSPCTSSPCSQFDSRLEPSF